MASDSDEGGVLTFLADFLVPDVPRPQARAMVITLVLCLGMGAASCLYAAGIVWTRTCGTDRAGACWGLARLICLIPGVLLALVVLLGAIVKYRTLKWWVRLFIALPTLMIGLSVAYSLGLFE
jgi:hypothetical protein